MSEMREFIHQFIGSRELSLSRFSSLLGYKSKTSLVRLMEEGSREKSIRQFESAMLSTFDLTEDERSALRRAAEITVRGRAAYLAEQEMWRFVRGSLAEDNAKLTIFASSTGDEIDLPERYSTAHKVRVTLLNSCSAAIFPMLKTLLARENVLVEHYVLCDSNAAKTLCTVNSLMSVFYEKRYSCFIRMTNPFDDATKPQGVTNADMMVISYVTEDNELCEDIVVFHHRTLGILLSHRVQPGLFGQSACLNTQQYTPLKRSFFLCSAFDNYVEFSRDCAQLEYNRSSWRIKPDVGMDWIDVDILLAALKGGPLPESEQDPQVIAALYDIFAQRYHNTFSKRRSAHTILKRGAMRRFALTGRASDHFWAMRPYTPQERIAILTQLLAQHQSNPHFHIYFLKDDDLLRDAEITLYDGLGILTAPSDTNYNLVGGHSEIMLDHAELMRLFKDFYMKDLVKNHVLPEEETSRFLQELIDMVSEL